MRRVFLVSLVIAVLLVGVGVVLLNVPAVQDRIVERGIARLAGATAEELFRDGALRVVLCGSSSPFPHPERARPCVAVFAAGRFFVVDVGPGSWNRLALLRVPGERIGAVLLTHFHSDHIGELGEFDLQTWVAGRPGPLRVIGPPGVERVVAGFAEAYELDAGYRTAHHGAELLPPDVGRMEALLIAGQALDSGPVTVLDEGGLRISAFAVDHAPVSPAVGYRFDYRGRSVVVSGDTKKLAGLIAAARGADVLLHEAQANHLVAAIGAAAGRAGRSRVAKIMQDIPSYHTTPVQAAESANEAGVRLLVFYHLTPPPTNWLVEQVFLRGVAEVRPEGWILGDDGLLIELPSDSDEVVIGQLD